VNGVGRMICSMWRLTAVEAINRQTPRAKGGVEPGQKAPGPIRLGWPAQALSGPVRARVPP
jgi:hypothetical protein